MLLDGTGGLPSRRHVIPGVAPPGWLPSPSCLLLRDNDLPEDTGQAASQCPKGKREEIKIVTGKWGDFPRRFVPLQT